MADVLRNLSFSKESQNMLDFLFFTASVGFTIVQAVEHSVFCLSNTGEIYGGTVPGLVE